MDTAFGARYRELYERHWWWRARERMILDILRARRPTRGWHSILDVGCGDGLFFDALLQLDGVHHVEGVEPASELVTPRSRHGHRIHTAPFDSAFDPGRRYSLILLLDVVEHLQDPVAALRHASTLLDHDGMILITVPAFMWLWTRHDELNRHYARFDLRSFRALADAAGLRIDKARYFFHWATVAKLAVRFLEAFTSGRPTVPRIPPRPINAALYALSRFEQRLTTRLSLPFGSSLLVVAGRR